ncbi:hypothetical protein [Haloferax sp. YSSS75]|uniref:hypothetical protein n=1 Tax=Haloferax sp. YSSS75 TaxID=3388564 RepID=UPI00398CB4FB
MRWSLRAILGSLQLPVAGVGVVVLALASWNLYTLPPSPPGSDGFVEGLAVFFLFVGIVVGFVLLVLGLLIPPGPGYGIHFTRRQRWLFAYALVGPIAGLLGTVSLAFLTTGPWVTTLVAVAVGTAPLAVLVGIGWRAGQVAFERYGEQA